MKRLMLYAMLVIAFLCCLSCGGLVWLPDSSGFVFIRKGGRLIHYDLRKRAQRVIVQHEWLTADDHGLLRLPAMHPDGTQVALVRAWKSASPTVQILIYALDGTLVHDSKELRFGAAKAADQESNATPTEVPVLSWFTPDGNRVVFAPHGEGEGVGSYQPNGAAVKMHPVYGVPALLSAFCGLSPCTPDGKGFLAIRKKSDDFDEELANLIFVDWEGWEYALKINPTAQQILAESKDSKAGSDFFPLAAWKGNVGEVQLPTGRLRIDLDEREIGCEADAQAKELWEHALATGVGIFPLSEEVLLQKRSEQVEKPAPDPSQGTITETKVRIELAVPAEGKVRPLLMNLQDSDLFFYPSPNRRYVVIRYQHSGSDESELTLFDVRGETLGTW
jgi:hypothetical protein